MGRPTLTTIRFAVISIFILLTCSASGQKQTLDGKEYTTYNPRYFKPHRGLFYNIYASGVYTVDPLGIGGKSAYALSLGTRINLWESKTPDKALAGLKVNGWYVGGGYEYFPQQYDKAYISLWVRIKTFMRFVGRMDFVYSFGNGLTGTGSRYCAGFEVGKIIIMVDGELFNDPNYDHPRNQSKYFNQAAIIVIVPLYTRK